MLELKMVKTLICQKSWHHNQILEELGEKGNGYPENSSPVKPAIVEIALMSV